MTKGVISAIWEDKDMPVDMYGDVADIIKCPKSVFNRLNPSQFYEQFLNKCSRIVQRNVINMDRAGKSIDEMYTYVLDYLNTVRPVYANFINTQITDQNKKEKFVDDVIVKGIYLVIPPYCKSLSEELVLKLADKYNIQEGPVKYNIIDKKGIKKSIKTKFPVFIGEKYLYLLCKIPLYMLSSIGMGYVSQFELPIKSKSKYTKYQSLFKQTAIRLGEDETGILIMSIGAEVLIRMLCSNGISPEVSTKLAEQLLTQEKPSAIKDIDMTTKEMIEYNRNINLFRHQMTIAGYNITAQH